MDRPRLISLKGLCTSKVYQDLRGEGSKVRLVRSKISGRGFAYAQVIRRFLLWSESVERSAYGAKLSAAADSFYAATTFRQPGATQFGTTIAVHNTRNPGANGIIKEATDVSPDHYQNRGRAVQKTKRASDRHIGYGHAYIARGHKLCNDCIGKVSPAQPRAAALHSDFGCTESAAL